AQALVGERGEQLRLQELPGGGDQFGGGRSVVHGILTSAKPQAAKAPSVQSGRAVPAPFPPCAGRGSPARRSAPGPTGGGAPGRRSRPPSGGCRAPPSTPPRAAPPCGRRRARTPP